MPLTTPLTEATKLLYGGTNNTNLQTNQQKLESEHLTILIIALSVSAFCVILMIAAIILIIRWKICGREPHRVLASFCCGSNERNLRGTFASSDHTALVKEENV